jgi:hypothetical protein
MTDHDLTLLLALAAGWLLNSAVGVIARSYRDE